MEVAYSTVAWKKLYNACFRHWTTRSMNLEVSYHSIYLQWFCAFSHLNCHSTSTASKLKRHNEQFRKEILANSFHPNWPVTSGHRYSGKSGSRLKVQLAGWELFHQFCWEWGTHKSPKMLKMASESFIHALLLFLGLFLKISRSVPLLFQYLVT